MSKPTEVQFEETRRQLTEELEVRARLGLIRLLSETLGGGDLIMLSSLGIDGRQKMLDVFIEQCQILKKEID